ncbi:MAG: flagellar type III secretion system protein FliQ [Peptococcaceae bacterium]|nr:flagellar type III secretion system protein FliQ [Peptococcaceae bacterium]
MTQTFVIHLARETLLMVLLLAGPAMFTALLIGLTISILQATTQIQDQLLNMVPKIVGVFVVLLLLGSWLLNMAIYFTTNVFAQIPNILR